MDKPIENHPAPVRSIEITMPDKGGFHLRIVSRFVKETQRFRSAIRVRSGETIANGKSILELLVLAAGWKSKLHIEAEGNDAEETIEGIRGFFRDAASVELTPP